MEIRKSAIDEILRLRLHQSHVESCRKWASGSAVVCISLFFAPHSVEYQYIKSALQVLLLLIALCSIGFVYFSGKPKTKLSQKQMKLLGLSEDDVIQQANFDTKVSSEKTGNRLEILTPPVRTGPSQIASRTSNFNNFSPVMEGYKKQPTPQHALQSTPYSQRREITSPRAYHIPNETPQTDRNNYDITNITRIADNCWHDISKNILSSQGKTHNTHTPALPSGGNSNMGGGAQTAGGSYRGFGSSPGGVFASGSGSKGSSGTYSYNAPYGRDTDQDRSFKSFKTYNVSPMMDTMSPAGLYSSLLGSKGKTGPKGTGGVKFVSVNALSSLGLTDISDVWIDKLKRILGGHLQASLHSLDNTVESLLQRLKERGLGEHVAAARSLLELKTEKESFGGGNKMDLPALLSHVQATIDPRAVAEFQSVQALFCPIKSILNVSGSGASPGPVGVAGVPFSRVQGAYLRAREMNRSQDKFLRISWSFGQAPSSPFSSYLDSSQHGDSALSDSDLVMSIFMHMCDTKAAGSGVAHKFSAAHYATSLPEIPEISATHGSSIGILRQEALLAQGPPGGPSLGGVGSGSAWGVKSPGGNVVAKPHFDVYSMDSRTTDILSIEMGRQNCFMSIIVFLLKSVKAAAEASVTHSRAVGGTNSVYVSPVIRDLCLEIFQMRDMSSVFDYLSSLGLDCGVEDLSDRYSQ